MSLLTIFGIPIHAVPCSSSLVSLKGILPSTYLVDRADISYTSLSFSFLLFFYNSLLQNLEISSFLLFFPEFFSALYLVHTSILFYSSFCSLFCFLPLCLFTLFSDLPYCFLFKSAILSFLFSYYTILPASPLCSITIQSAFFLLFLIFLEASI